MTTTMEFEKAIGRLEEALKKKKDEFIRDSVIQRFEFTFELAWKSSRRVLGLSSSAPRVGIREMAQQGVIDSPESWFEYLEARNLSSHAYKEKVAEKVYGVAKEFAPIARELLKKLKAL